MNEPITRPLSEEEIARFKRLFDRMNQGGTISIQDPRVNQVQTWLIGLVGAAIVGSMLWLANSVDTLNRNFAGISVWKEYVDQRLGNLERKP